MFALFIKGFHSLDEFPYKFYIAYFHTNFLLFCWSITFKLDLISIWIFFSLCWQLKYHTFYIDLCLYRNFFAFIQILNAVPLKQCVWLYYMNFKYPFDNVYDYAFFHHFHWLVLSLFLRLFQSNFSHITNYCPIYFPMKIILCNNNKVWLEDLLSSTFLSSSLDLFITICCFADFHLNLGENSPEASLSG